MNGTIREKIANIKKRLVKMGINYLRIVGKEESEKNKQELIDFIEKDDSTLLWNYMKIIKRERRRGMEEALKGGKNGRH